MSKYVKELVTRDIRRRLDGVDDAVLVNCVGMDANTTNELRGELDKRDIKLLVVKNSLARRATEGTQLSAAFEGASGQVGVCWVKEIVELDKDKEKFDAFHASGGVMDGEKLDADGLKAVSKWPSRAEQISMLVGQILSPGADLSAALLGPGKKLNSQIKQISEGDED